MCCSQEYNKQIKVNLMKFILLGILFIVGCSTMGTSNEDCTEVKIRGAGHYKRPDGCEITGETWWPKVPQLKVQQ